MNFAESQQYLFSLGNEVSAMKLGLENIRTLLDALGKPQDKYRKVQIAGTNGKGSVCAFLDSICREASITTGLYTSPHLVSITERVKINGVDISESDFARVATHVRDTAEKLLTDGKLEYRPTFFEQMTAIALVAFAEANVDLAILETGLGGRLDATTAANAEIAAITRIDLDHQEYLGDTIEKIAAEKAAIIKEWSRAVVGEQVPEAENVIRDRCIRFGVDSMHAASVSTTCGSGWLNFETDHAEYCVKKLGLFGLHQIENAKIAILISEQLKAHFSLKTEDVVHGLENARHPGRLEYQGKYLFDGAHNIGGAKALAAFLEEFEQRPITMIFGAMKDKSVTEILTLLAPLTTHIVVTVPENPRAVGYIELLEQLPTDMSKERTFATDTVEHAIDIAETITPDDGVILVTGSLYLIGEVKYLLAGRSGFEI